MRCFAVLPSKPCKLWYQPSLFFGRLKDLDSPVEENGLKERLQMLALNSRSGSIPTKSVIKGLLQLPHEPTPEPLVNGQTVEEENLDQDLADDLERHGLPSIKELMRVLVSLLDPYDLQHTDTMRLTALNILTSVF
ncbi:hypothetical protein PCASD_09522 [Puccinia coronata f. sp. avenae]|uniref:Uncharacterized protein n=1 Tax=Puccinia coronata f. sp. avenae TaxID=200324 RepID=A0A2N5U5Z7_9BASI|nr:hypothetical protein PCASD_09522 [Puccinia coronata f. sp. avenae]